MILGINTASEKVSIALYQPGKIAKEISWQSYRTQSKELLPKIDKLLKQSKVKLPDLKAIAVFQGPGSYTGLRVGISVANALAWSLNIKVIGIKDYKVVRIEVLEIAKRANKLLKKKKSKKFSKIVVPFYGSRL